MLASRDLLGRTLEAVARSCCRAARAVDETAYIRMQRRVDVCCCEGIPKWTNEMVGVGVWSRRVEKYEVQYRDAAVVSP